MFAPLQLQKSQVQFLKRLGGELLLPNKKKECEAFHQGILSKVTTDGVIDGSNLSLLTFPFDKEHYDVFISYSHNDEPEALYLCAYLRKHGLSCFLDSTIWNSADSLLAVIDKKYSRADDQLHYDYEKRNYSTSHVHAMLSMAMLEGIKRSECCIFLRSNNSLTLKDGIENQTLSPWIYEEASFINNVQISIPDRFKKPELKIFCEGGRVEMRDSHTQELKVTYKVNLTNFITITYRDIYNKYGTSMLDDIYRTHGVVGNVIQRLLG